MWSQTFTYDAFGNITKAGTNSFNPGYNAATNRMSSGATYDANGDVLTDSLHTFVWDAETRPTTIDAVTATYDALGRMVEQTKSGTSTEIQYAPTGFKMQTLNGQTVKNAFIPLPGGTVLVPQCECYFHGDWLGGSRFASRYSDRTMYNDLAYAPFGEQYATAGGTGVGNATFAGNRNDTTTNLYDAQFREYEIYGRWPSPDPAGMASANPANPQSWNRYAYALNNPLLFIDPSGLDPAGTPCTADDMKKGIYDPGNGTACICKAGGTICVWAVTTNTVTVNGNTPPPIPVISGPLAGPPAESVDNNQSPGSGNGSNAFQLTPQPKKPSCFSVFLNAAQNADFPIPQMPAGSNPEDLVKSEAQAGAAYYAFNQALSVPLRSSIVRGILGIGENLSIAFVAAPILNAGIQGVVAEFQANRARTCSTVF